MQHVEVVKALFFETGTYNDLTLRPYETNLKGHIVSQFAEATNGGQAIAASTLAGVANQFLRPSAQQQQLVSIQNGWQEPRLRFLIMLDYQGAMGTVPVRKILQGYTSHLGALPSGAVDPAMTLYFNNVITLRRTQIETPAGISYLWAPSEANHLLRGDYELNFGQQQNVTWLMRPQDVFATMGRAALGSEDVLDLRVAFADSPIRKSRRSNCSAPHYVADVLKGYRKTFDFSDHAVDLHDAMATAQGLVQENSLTADPFFHDLTTKTSNFSQGGSVTYGELMSLFPNFDHIAAVILSKQMLRSSPQPYMNHQAGQTEYWTGSTMETVWASILGQSVPSLMMDLLLTRISFSATNQTITGETVVTPMDHDSFAEDMDMRPYVEHFITRLTTEVLRGLTTNSHMDFSLSMMVDTVGETRISLSLAGAPFVDYVTPSFCDALFSPVLTNNHQHILNVANDLQVLSDQVSNNTVYSRGSTHQPFLTGGANDSFI